MGGRDHKRWWSQGFLILLFILVVAVSGQEGPFVVPVFAVPSGITYYVQIVVGTPVYSPGLNNENTFNLIIDTGSSNEAIASPSCCSNIVDSTKLFSCSSSSTCVASQQSVSVKYIAGSWEGVFVKDTFSSAAFGSFQSVSFAQITSQSNFIQRGDYQGILGLAYQSIAQPQNDHPGSTFFDTIVSTGRAQNVFSLLLCGAGVTATGTTAGYWESANEDYSSSSTIYYTPLVQEKWYVVLVTDLAYGDSSLGIPCNELNSAQTIVDSGTSNMAFTSAVYNTLVEKIKQATLEALPNFPIQFFQDTVPCCESYCNTNLLSLPNISVSLAFDDGSRNSDQQFTVNIPPSYYWRPVNIVDLGIQCRVFGISESSGGNVLGNVFMDGLYVIHDRESQKIGLGVAKDCPNGLKSLKSVSTVTKFSTGSWCTCCSSNLRSDTLLNAYFPGVDRCFFWFWWTYVVLVAVIIIVLCLAYIFYVYISSWARKRRRIVTVPSTNEFTEATTPTNVI